MVIKVNGKPIPDEHETREPVAVAMWYDRRLRMWTLYPVDAEGVQLQAARYAPRKDLARILKKDIEAEIESGDRAGYYY